MIRKFNLFLVVLLVAGLLAISQHHHDDLEHHDECAICQVLDCGFDVAEPVVLSLCIGVAWILSRIQKRFVSYPRIVLHFSRAPPQFRRFEIQNV